MFFDEAGVETVVSGGNGCMGGEYDFAGNPRDGSIKADPFVFHAHTNRLQHGEGAMAFIQVKDAGRDPKGFEGAQSTYPE